MRLCYVVLQDIRLENLAPRSTTTNAAGQGLAVGPYKRGSSLDPAEEFGARPNMEPSTVALAEDHSSAEALHSGRPLFWQVG